MRAFPYRAELRARVLGTTGGSLIAFAVIVAFVAAADRLGDQHLSGWIAVALAGATLLTAAAFTGGRRRLLERLGRARPLDDRPCGDHRRHARRRRRRVLLVARHERTHGHTVYRLDDGTDELALAA